MKTTHPLRRAPRILAALLALASRAVRREARSHPRGRRVQLTLTAVDVATTLEGLAATRDWEHGRDRHPYFRSANVTFSSALA